MSAEHTENPNYLHLVLYLAGGLCTGFGILNLYWSFGWLGGPLNSDFKKVGYTGLDNIELLSAADYSIWMIVFGVLLLVFANASAWRHTDGY